MGQPFNIEDIRLRCAWNRWYQGYACELHHHPTDIPSVRFRKAPVFRLQIEEVFCRFPDSAVANDRLPLDDSSLQECSPSVQGNDLSLTTQDLGSSYHMPCLVHTFWHTSSLWETRWRW